MVPMQRVGKSLKGREFQKRILQAWKDMEFIAWVGKINVIKNIVVIGCYGHNTL